MTRTKAPIPHPISKKQVQVIPQLLMEDLQGLSHLVLDGFNGNIHHGGDLGVFELLLPAQDKHLPAALGQLSQGLLQASFQLPRLDGQLNRVFLHLPEGSFFFGPHLLLPPLADGHIPDGSEQVRPFRAGNTDLIPLFP